MRGVAEERAGPVIVTAKLRSNGLHGAHRGRIRPELRPARFVSRNLRSRVRRHLLDGTVLNAVTVSVLPVGYGEEGRRGPDGREHCCLNVRS